MRKAKKWKRTYNISLIKLAGFRRLHPFLLLRKLWNELFNKTNIRQKALPAAELPQEKSVRRDMLSIIVCTLGESGVLPKTLQSLREQALAEEYEILLVDNSPEGNLSALAVDGVRYVRAAEPGLSRARNIGAEAAAGAYLLYIDDDAVAEPAAAAELLSAFRAHKKAGVVGGQIRLVLPVPAPWVFVPGRESVWSGYTVPYQKYREVREQYAFPYGACFGVRYTALREAGGFPEAYGRTGHDYAGGEETAVCFAVRQRGWRIGIMPSAAVHHHPAAERYTEEHIDRTIRAGILTTQQLYLDGYAPEGWTKDYVSMRIDIARKEARELRRQGEDREAFYVECEKNAFLELYQTMEESC